MANFSELLEPIAQWFSSLGIPEPIVHWGHPLMMGIVVIAMGSAAGIAGWRGRIATDAEIATKNRDAHRKIAPLMFLFMALGFTGGVLSLVMQHQPIFESSHFWTSTLVLGLLAFNGILAVTGFGGNKLLRTIHAYVGTVALVLMVIHGLLGLKLGLAI
jgi:F0F1-type ATP synthase membrane subunit c/vacuolar-type H+-ATPase subunit K